MRLFGRKPFTSNKAPALPEQIPGQQIREFLGTPEPQTAIINPLEFYRSAQSQALPIATRRNGYFDGPPASPESPTLDDVQSQWQWRGSRPWSGDDTPPPSYTMVRNLDRPEIAGLILPRDTFAADGITGETLNTNNGAGANPPAPALTSSNMASLEDIRYLDVARTVHMKSRISSVHQYPVELTTITAEVTPPESIEEKREEESDIQTSSLSEERERPVSVASTNTAGIYLAVGQLPGTEPLDMALPSPQVLAMHLHAGAQSVTTTSPTEERDPKWETAQAVTVRIVRNPSDIAEPGKDGDTSVAATAAAIRRISLVSSLSSATAAESLTLSPRSKSDERASSASSKTTASASATSPVKVAAPSSPPDKPMPINDNDKSTGSDSQVARANLQIISTHDRSFLDMSEEVNGNEPLPSPLPPMPPPKDPGYVSRPRPSAAPVVESHARYYQKPVPPTEEGMDPKQSEFGLVGGVGNGQAGYQIPQSHDTDPEKRPRKQWVWRRVGKQGGGGGFTGIKLFEKASRPGSPRGDSSSTASSTSSEDGANGHADTDAPNHRRLQLFSAWGRFIGKGIPKPAILRGS